MDLQETKVESAPELFDGYHQWRCSLPRRGKFCYRHFGGGGSLTANEIYEWLDSHGNGGDSEFSCFPLVEAYGAVEYPGGVKVDYELTKADVSCSSIRDWVGRHKKSEKSAITLATAFGKLIKDCLDKDVMPLSISPTDLLVKQDDDGVRFKFAHLGGDGQSIRASVLSR